MPIQTNPRVFCDACGESRDCTLHQRAEFPPDAAKKYLRKHCDNEPGACKFRYQAGIWFEPKPLSEENLNRD
jgi:hypothetical protein